MSHRPPRFASDDPIRLAAAAAVTFKVDAARRTITGLALPYGVVAQSGWSNWRFSQGTITWADVSRVKLFMSHDPNQAIGKATALDDREDGLYATFSVARGAEGDRALALAEDGVYDGLSVGLAPGGTWTYSEADDVNDAVSMPLMEISLTPIPAFDDARVTDVAASAAHHERNRNMKCTKCGQVHANGVTACDPQALAAFSQGQGQGQPSGQPAQPAAPADPAPAGPDFSGLSEAITTAVQSAFSAALGQPVPPREVVPAGQAPAPAAARFSVTEALPYRFDGIRGEHEFSADVQSYTADPAARQRIDRFMADAFARVTAPRFAIAAADVAPLNPVRQRPDLWVDELEYEYPLYRALNSGGLTDGTPFVFPKFVSKGGMVNDHQTGVEPDSGTYVTTSQTVTPTTVSGKVTIPREVWDQGGTPQLSGLLWSAMVRSWFEALEAEAATLLAGQAYDAAHTFALVGTDEALAAAWSAALVGLQFVRGGNRMRVAAAASAWYGAMAGAEDTTGRKLYPMANPTNANGAAAPLFSSLNADGVTIAPSWAIQEKVAAGDTGAGFLANPDDAHVWASTPTRLDFPNVEVANVHIALWGYKATAVSRLDGLRKVTYDDGVV